MTERCATVARDHTEWPGGSASRARRWLLVEQPGPWGRDAIRESNLPSDVADHLERLGRELPARVLLLRRTGGTGSPGTERVVMAGVSSPQGGGWLERFWLDDIRQLLDLDLSGVAAGRSAGGEPLSDPTYLVCTNGKHDACCATYGLPVAQRLTELRAAQVWECSHVGGDRFAANLVCLPDGIFYGHVAPDEVGEVVDAHERRRMLLTRCRGRSALAFPAQAAELLVRTQLGLDGLDDLRFDGMRRQDTDFRVRFRGPGGGPIDALVQRHAHPDLRVMTCGTDPAAPPIYALAALDLGAGALITDQPSDQ